MISACERRWDKPCSNLAVDEFVNGPLQLLVAGDQRVDVSLGNWVSGRLKPVLRADSMDVV